MRSIAYIVNSDNGRSCTPQGMFQVFGCSPQEVRRRWLPPRTAVTAGSPSTIVIRNRSSWITGEYMKQTWCKWHVAQFTCISALPGSKTCAELSAIPRTFFHPTVSQFHLPYSLLQAGLTNYFILWVDYIYTNGFTKSICFLNGDLHYIFVILEIMVRNSKYYFYWIQRALSKIIPEKNILFI